jgi:hypothetical protein
LEGLSPFTTSEAFRYELVLRVLLFLEDNRCVEVRQQQQYALALIAKPYLEASMAGLQLLWICVNRTRIGPQSGSSKDSRRDSVDKNIQWREDLLYAVVL